MARCFHLEEAGWQEFRCGITGVSVEQDCLTASEGPGGAGMCIPRLALRWLAESLDIERFGNHTREIIMQQAAKIEEQMTLRAGMTEAEIDAVLARARDLKRAITWGKKRLGPLREHIAGLRAQLKLSLAALNDLEEGRMPTEMPKIKRRWTPEEKAKFEAAWTPEKRAAQAKRLVKMQAARAAKRRAGAKA